MARSSHFLALNTTAAGTTSINRNEEITSLSPWSICILAFTRPKAGREVGPLNWTQKHKSVWDSPASKATGHAPRPARDWPVPLSYHRPALKRAREVEPRRPLRTPACVARGDFLEVGNFAPFSAFLHIKGRNFPDFSPFTSTYDPYERWQVSWKSVRTFLRNPEDRHTQTDAAALYTLDRYIAKCWPIFNKLSPWNLAANL